MANTRIPANTILLNYFCYSEGDLKGKPLDEGKIYFYENNNHTLKKNTYADPFKQTVNPNPITLTPVGTHPIIYMEPSAYYIVIEDKFENLIATIEDYLPGSGGDSPSDAVQTDNLLPSFGFDTQVFGDIYSSALFPLPQGKSSISLGWIFDWTSTIPSSTVKNYYTFKPLNNSGITGSPKNLINIVSSGNAAGDITKRLHTKIGTYNAFQGEQLGFSIHAKLLIGGFATLPVTLIRTKAGVEQSAIAIGNIDIVLNTLTQTQFTFTVPLLADSGFLNDDVLLLVITFPNNQDFDIQFTGTWVQESPSGSFNISEENTAIDATKMLFNTPNEILSPTYSKEYAGLPLIFAEDGIRSSATTGNIKLFPTASSIRNYYRMYDNIELIGSNVEGKGALARKDDTTSDRLITAIRTNPQTIMKKSEHSFELTKIGTDQIDWTTGLGATELTAWSDTNTGGRIAITKVNSALPYKLKATHNVQGRVTLTFTDNFIPGKIPFDPKYNAGSTPSVYNPLPAEHPIICWLGGTALGDGVSGNEVLFRGLMEFLPALGIATLNLGSASSAAEVEIYFPPVTRGYNLTAIHSPNAITGWSSDAIATSSYYSSAYHNVNTNYSSAVDGLAQFYRGMLTYNTIGDNPSTQAEHTPGAIKFSIDGSATPYTATEHNIIVSLSSGMTREQVASAVVEAVNKPFDYEMKFNSLPQNGDWVSISNSVTTYTLIWHDTAQSKPALPTTDASIYLEFESSQTISEVVDAMIETVKKSQVGIPLAGDLNLPGYAGMEYYIQA